MAGNSIKRNWLWGLFFIALAAAGVIALLELINIQSDEKNAVILGFSIQRLLLLISVAIPSLAALFFSLRSILNPGWVETRLEPQFRNLVERRWLAGMCAALIIAGWLCLFMPSYWFKEYAAYFERLRPVFLYIAFCSLLTTVIAWIWVKGWRPDWILRSMHGQGRLIKNSAIILGITLGVWLLIAVTGLGIEPDPFYWHEAGVPLLGMQVLFSYLITIGIQQLVFANIVGRRKVWIDAVIAVGIWLAAFLIWHFTYMPRSFFAPGPYPPNNVYYPYSDAEYYLNAGQYLLMGQGIANGYFWDKPLYSLFLAILQLIAGQNITLLVSLQVAVMALAPVGLYFLGKELFNRQAGLLAALFAIYQQRNSIAATLEIQVSHSKLLLTEYPMALLLIFTSLLLVSWLKDPMRRPGLALVIGGALGVAALVRPNILILAPVLLVMILFFYRQAFKRGLLTAALFGIVFLLPFLPWNLVTPKGAQDPNIIIKARAIFDTRYTPVQFESVESRLDSLPAPDSQSTPVVVPTPVMSSSPTVEVETAPLSVEVDATNPGSFILPHFLHNEIMAFLILPHTIELRDLNHTLETPYWKSIASWEGELPIGSILLAFLNLILVAVGIAVAWRRLRLAGLAPLLVHVSYYLANGLVRNSGARYLVPVDWVLLLYYALGIVQAVSWLARLLGISKADQRAEQGEVAFQPTGSQPATLRWQKALLISALFLGFGLTLPFGKYAFPVVYPQRSPTQILADLREKEWNDMLVGNWLERLQSDQAVDRPGVAVVYGRGLYPRFYFADTAEPNGELSPKFAPSTELARFTLRILAPENQYWAILPMEVSPQTFPDGAPVAAIGCWHTGSPYIDAVAIMVLSDPGEVYRRINARELDCPLALP